MRRNKNTQPDRQGGAVSRADEVSKLFNALSAGPSALLEPTAAPLRRLLDTLNQGAVDQVRPPEVVEGPHGQVYSDQAAAKVVVVVSIKGGVGRSTLTAAIASGLQRQGHPTLALDLDPQNALCQHLCPGIDVPGLGVVSLLNQTWEGLPRRGFAGCRLVAFGATDALQLQSLNRWLVQDAEFLSKRLAGLNLNGQDTLIIDVPAGHTPFLRQAMSVADAVLVVMQCDATSYRTLTQIENLLAPYPAPERLYVINQVDAAHVFSQDMAEVFKQRLGEAVVGWVHRDGAFSEAQAFGLDPLDPVVSSVGCQDVNALCRALAQRVKKQARQPLI